MKIEPNEFIQKILPDYDARCSNFRDIYLKIQEQKCIDKIECFGQAYKMASCENDKRLKIEDLTINN